MANINENFVVKTGLEVGPTVITAATGNLTTTGNIQVGNTVIDGVTGNITVGATTINGTTGEIRTTANVVTTNNFVVGTTVLSPSGAVTTNNIITTGGTVNNTTIGATTPAPAYFTTLDATGTLTTNDILPHVTNVSNIGSSTQRFQTIWVNDLRLSTNTLYLGETPILGTTGTVVNVHTDPGQSLSLQTSGAAGAMSLVSEAPIAMQTIGNNSDVTIQSNGTGSKTKLLSTTSLELTAPALTLTGTTTNTGSFTVNGNTVLNGNVTITGTQATVNAAQLTVEDPVVILNSGETGLGVTNGTSGIQFARGQLGSYQLVFKEADQSLQFGPVGSTLAMADKNWAATTFVAKNSTDTLGNLTVTGSLSAGSFSGPLTGNVTGHASLDLPLTGGTLTGPLTATGFSGSGAGLTGTASSLAAGSITGQANSATITATSANTANTIVLRDAIGNFSAGTMTAIASQAIYADLAEMYVSDSQYEPGTVLVFGGSKEVTTTETFADVAVAGVVSTAPAYLMNKDQQDAVAVALRGKVPVKVIGAVEKGDLLVTSAIAGYARSVRKDASYPIATFAKALESDASDGMKVITAVII